MDGKIKFLKNGYTAEDKPITIDSPYDLKEAGWSTEETNEFTNHNILSNTA